MKGHRNSLGKHQYLRFVRSLSRCLWAVDPEYMGSKIQGPDDEYDQAAEQLITRLVGCKSKEEVLGILDRVYPAVSGDIVDCAWLALSDYNSKVP